MLHNQKELEKNSIVCDDAYEHLSEIKENSFDHVITSPPYYDQRDYEVNGQLGMESSVEDYISNLLEIFEECLRVVKEDGNVVFNIGDKRHDRTKLLIPYRFATEAVDRFDSVCLVNDITWLKSNPTPEQGDHYLTESTEPFLHFAQSDDYYHNPDNFMSHLDESKTKEKAKSRTQEYGKGYYDKIEEGDLSDEEKKRARAALDEVREKVQQGEIPGFRMKIRGVHALPYGGRGGRMTHIDKQGYSVIELTGSVMKKDVIECSVENMSGWNGEHPAIYPEYIIKELLDLLTTEEDFILDPFLGSGTTAAVCEVANRYYYGIDLNEDYCRKANERVAEALLGISGIDAVDVQEVTERELRILMATLRNPKSTQAEIAEKLSTSQANVSATVSNIDGFEWGDQK